MCTITIPVSTGVLVGNVVRVGIDSVGITVVVGVTIPHSTWEGSGDHLPLLPHVEF